MEPEELFGTLLALGECWWVKGVIYQESLRRFVIEIEETDQLWSHERCRFLDVFSGTGTISFTEKTQPEYLFRTLLPQCVSIMARLP